MVRSLLWSTLVIGLKSIKGEHGHISKCWKLISKGLSRCLSILYWVSLNINSIILIHQLLLLYSVLQLDSALRTKLHILKGELQSLLPYLIYHLIGPLNWSRLWYLLWSAPPVPTLYTHKSINENTYRPQAQNRIWLSMTSLLANDTGWIAFPYRCFSLY